MSVVPGRVSSTSASNVTWTLPGVQSYLWCPTCGCEYEGPANAQRRYCTAVFSDGDQMCGRRLIGPFLRSFATTPRSTT